MYLIRRDVRFSVDPFGHQLGRGHNIADSLTSTGGIGVGLELGVCVRGGLDDRSGFVVDVRQIDQMVWEKVVPAACDMIRSYFCDRRPVGLDAAGRLLRLAWRALEVDMGDLGLAGLVLRFSPCRSVQIRAEEEAMIYYTERFEFSAAHRLWNPRLSESENRSLFGSCANPNGHGHSYRLEVVFAVPAGKLPDTEALTRAVCENVVSVLDHKNLNLDVPFFGGVNPTMENIARFVWEALAGKLGVAKLDCVTVWESDRSSCTFRGQAV